MHHFQHINPIRDEDGKLRDWKDYDWLSRLENKLDVVYNNFVSDNFIDTKHEFINERSKIQNGVQKVR